MTEPKSDLTPCGRRRNKRWGELVVLAAQLGGVSKVTIYGVLNRKFKSAPATRAIKQARQQLREAKAAARAARSKAA